MKHKGTAPLYAAEIILGRMELDDVPEGQQISVKWFLERCGPDTGIGENDARIAIVGFMRRIERMRRELRSLEEENDELRSESSAGVKALPTRLDRDLAEPLCLLEGQCERTGECYGDCECSSSVQQAWTTLRAKLVVREIENQRTTKEEQP